MAWGWGATAVPWDTRPCPGAVAQGRGGTLRSVGNRGGKAPLPRWMWSQEPPPPAPTGLEWPQSQLLPRDASSGPAPGEQQVFHESL